MEDKQEVTMKINMPADKVTGEYCNSAIIGYSQNEFTLDMVHVLPPGDNGVLKQRLIMAPVAAKMFLRSMKINIEAYEKNFGVIELPLGGLPLIPGAGGKA